ncbi:hypothetical protein JRQ81_012284 [Phrynocephalus forsythii]|uniref:C2H2-type domain-containing protein n=1 Tax=Phrynocephalus forsythii TaxID=171643 RepID=A0A9Q0X8T1_9SAUR|nr:hypothetical protein JRQ81_012284 [Phrynocephalus forsythii]
MVIQKRKAARKSSAGEKGFIQQLYLTKHGQSIQAGPKPHTCSECGKGFNYQTNLKVHQRVHTGEKPYECPECGKAFGYSTNLKSHLRIHTEEMLYDCLECGKAFSSLTKFRWHERVHRKKPPPCLDGPKETASGTTNLKARQHLDSAGRRPTCALSAGRCSITA